MLLMGNLRYSLLIGKLTGQVGVKVLENTKTPIFIGWCYENIVGFRLS